MFEKCDLSNRQKRMVASFSISTRFTAKFELVFVLTQEHAFSQRFHFKANRKSKGSSKNRYQGFLKYPPFERSACYYVTISRNFEGFQYFSFETNFLKNANPFPEYYFLVESITIGNATIPLKTALSEASVKTNRMGSKK